MNGTKILLTSLILAIVITFLTGLINTTPDGLIGARWYGFPAAWVSMLAVAPQYNPWQISYFGFLVDIVLWSVIIGIVLSATSRKEGAEAAPRQTRRGRPRRS